MGALWGKNEGNSSGFVSLYQSLIPYYPAAALERERRIDTNGEERKFKVWVDWFPGGKSVLVEDLISTLPKTINLLCRIKNLQEIIQTAFTKKTQAAREWCKNETQNIQRQKVTQLG